MLGSPHTVRFPQPFDLLPPRIANGVRWDAGAFTVDRLRYRERGEILGLQAAKSPAGDFDSCLVVRHRGAFGGVLTPAPGTEVQVSEGRVERTQWLARGIGPVLVKETVSMVMRIPREAPVTARVTRQSALVGVRRPAASAR